MTDPADDEPTEEQIIQAWRMLTAEARGRVARAILNEIDPPIAAAPKPERRGRPGQSDRDLEIARLWKAYVRTSKRPEMAKFIKNLPEPLRKSLTVKNLYRVIAKGRPFLRRRERLARVIAKDPVAQRAWLGADALSFVRLPPQK